MSCLQNVTTKKILNNYGEKCLLSNDTQAVKYETGIIKLKNYEKQIPISSKVYADTECLLKRINIDEGKYTNLSEKYIPKSVGGKLVCTGNRFILPSIIFGKNCINKFIKWIFTQQEQINQIIKENLNKKLKMRIEMEQNYQDS